MSALTSLLTLYLNNNYLTMGGETSVPISTFSSYTLSGNIDLADNCLVFYTTSSYLEMNTKKVTSIAILHPMTKTKTKTKTKTQTAKQTVGRSHLLDP